jgi:hypothetical protein
VTEESTTVEVSRRIVAPAPHIFEILSKPQGHADIDGSGMLRGADDNYVISAVGDTFIVKMHRLGRDYIMVNHVVEFEPNHRLVWEPAPGDLETAGGDPARVGVPSGYRWGFSLSPDGGDATDVTETFDCGSEENRWILQRDDGSWINGSQSVVQSMAATLERLNALSTR